MTIIWGLPSNDISSNFNRKKDNFFVEIKETDHFYSLIELGEISGSGFCELGFSDGWS